MNFKKTMLATGVAALMSTAAMAQDVAVIGMVHSIEDRFWNPDQEGRG